MNNEESKAYFGIGLDNNELQANAAKSVAILKGIGNETIAQGARIENNYKKIDSTIAMFGGGNALAGMAKELYYFANAFDTSMKEVSTLSSTVAGDMDGFKKSILDMTTKIPIGADEAAKALYQIVSAGHDGANGLHVLEVAAKAAIGGVTDTATAAKAITTVLNAYKLDASDATSVSDQLFTTVRLGKTTFGELGQSISQVAPIAASFGIETEQMLAAIATLTQSGVPTAQAITQIRAAILDASKELGDGYFATHTFQEGLEQIALKANGSESELRKMMPSVEGFNGLLGITGINSQTASSHLTELGNSFGATALASSTMTDTADSQIELLKNKMLAKFHEIGEGGVDMVGSVASFLNSDGVFSSSALDDLIATMGVLISTVGVYKAQLILVDAINKVKQNNLYSIQIAELQKLIGVKEIDKNHDLQKLVDNKKLTADQANKIAGLQKEVQAIISKMDVEMTALSLEKTNAQATIDNSTREIASIDVEIAKLREKVSATTAVINANMLANLEQQKADLLLEKKIALTDKEGLIGGRVAANKEIASLKELGSSKELIKVKQDEILIINDKLKNTEVELKSIDSNLSATKTQITETKNLTSEKAISSTETKINTLETRKSTLAGQSKSAQDKISAVSKDLDTKSIKRNTLQQNLNTVATKSATKAKGLMSIATGMLSKVFTGIGTAFKANPIGLVITGVTLLTSAFSSFTDAKKEEKKAIEAALKPMRDELTLTNLLVNKLKDANLKSSERKTILEELKKLNPDITKGITDEADAYEILSGRLEEYNKTQLAEMAVQKFSLTEDFESVVKNLDDANNAVKDKSADIIDTYSILFTRFRELEQENEDIPENLKTLFNSIIESSAPETEKVESMFASYDAILAKVKAGHGSYTGKGWTAAQQLFGGLNIKSYQNSVKELEEVTNDYEEQAGKFKDKINSIANAVFDGEEKQKAEFINSQMLKYLPLEVKEVEKADWENGAKNEFDATKSSLQDLISELPKAKEVLGSLTDPKDIENQRELIALIEAQTIARKKDIETQIEAKKLKQKDHEEAIFKQSEKNKTEIRKQGAEARMSLLTNDYDRSIQALKDANAEELRITDEARQNAKALAKDAKVPFDGSEFDITDSLSNKKYDDAVLKLTFEIDDFEPIELYDSEANKKALKNQENQEKAHLDTLISQYQSKADKIKDIETKKDADLLILKKARDKAETPEDKARLQQTIDTREQEAEFETLQQNIDWSALFSNLDSTTTNALKGLKGNIEKYVSEAGSDISPEIMQTIVQAMESLDTELIDRSPFAILADGYTEYSTALDKIRKAKKDIEKLEEDSLKNADAIKEKQKELSSVEADRFAASAKMSQSVNDIGNKGTDITNAGGEIVGMLENLGVAVPEAVTNSLAGVGQVMSGLASIDLTSPFSIVTGAITIFTGLVNSISAWFGSGDNVKEKEIQRIQKQVDSLDESYESLGEAIDRAYSTDASKLIQQQDEALHKQNQLLMEQKKLEESKKDPDTEAIDSYNDKLQENNDKLEENKNLAIDVIFGSDVKSAIDEFANAYVDAWDAGEDKSSAVKDVVKNMIKSVVGELVKGQIADAVNDFRNRLAEAMKDGIITAEEQRELDRLEQNIYDDAYIDPSVENYKNSKNSDEEIAEREASSKGIATASQESVDENNGRLTALQGLSYEINESVKNLRANSATIISILTGIQTDTGRLEAIENHMLGVVTAVREVKNGIDSINTRGIVIKR